MTTNLELHAQEEANWRAIRERDAAARSSLTTIDGRVPSIPTATELHAQEEQLRRDLAEREQAFNAEQKKLKAPQIQQSAPAAQQEPQRPLTMTEMKAKLRSLQNNLWQSADAVHAELFKRAYPDTAAAVQQLAAQSKPATPVHDPNVQTGISDVRLVAIAEMYGPASFAKFVDCLASSGQHAVVARALKCVAAARAAVEAQDALNTSRQFELPPFNLETQSAFLLWCGSRVSAGDAPSSNDTSARLEFMALPDATRNKFYGVTLR